MAKTMRMPKVGSIGFRSIRRANDVIYPVEVYDDSRGQVMQLCVYRREKHAERCVEAINRLIETFTEDQ